ncbi:alpha/beta hydrolase family protein [Gordonia sp. VNK21]|uniref:alpha/beta hydrolase family protein n=1 Tax=Gordonia sp. VNK21 TaxID=3382483 RepID=UPI0038D3B68A
MRAGRRTRALILAVSAALSVSLLSGGAGAPAQAEETGKFGSVIGQTVRPDGWRGLNNGRAIYYWTQNSDGRPVKASGALFLPDGPAPAGGWPVVAYDHGTSGYGTGCGGQSFADAQENRYITRLVRSGYAVIAPDYVGLGPYDTGVHPYLDGRSESAATIDLFTAARSLEPTLSRTWAVTGDSQGGQAALVTAHRQQTYGPKTDFRGVVAIDPESDVEKVMPLLGPYVPPVPPLGGSYGFLGAILAGLRDADPSARVNSYLTPAGRKFVDSIDDQCRPEWDEGMAFGSLLSRPLGQGPLPAALHRYMAVPVSGYDAPILLVLNTLDLTVPSPLHAKLAADLTLNGVPYRAAVAGGEHTDLDAAQWAAFDGFFARVLE